jgi:acetylornithine/succinyldiaminopimelate/putrescine aminotransferase
LLVNCTADKVIRFMPPLIITRSEVDESMAILRGALHQFAGEPDAH